MTGWRGHVQGLTLEGVIALEDTMGYAQAAGSPVASQPCPMTFWQAELVEDVLVSERLLLRRPGGRGP